VFYLGTYFDWIFVRFLLGYGVLSEYVIEWILGRFVLGYGILHGFASVFGRN
jgi:hypothetical protein